MKPATGGLVSRDFNVTIMAGGEHVNCQVQATVQPGGCVMFSNQGVCILKSRQDPTTRRSDFDDGCDTP
jgi:hypothetical protein